VKNSSKNLSIIDKDLTVEGTISCKGKLIVKGTVRGRLNGETVIIARGGAVYANTNVSSMIVGGIFEGDIRASEELIVLSTGKCSGKVICKNLGIEAKGMIKASVSSIVTQEKKSEKAAG